jgi:hypothetical protein
MVGLDPTIHAKDHGQTVPGKGQPYQHVSWFTRNGVNPRVKPEDDVIAVS